MTVPTPTYTDGLWGYDTFVENETTYARIVSYSGTGGGGVTITIPNTVGGYTVKEIGRGGTDETIWNNTTMNINTTLGPIPSTVTAINNYAFYNGVKVDMNMSVVLPPSLITIGDYAFGNGQSYTGDLIIPDSVTTIGNSAFSYVNCSKIVIPPNIVSIGSNAFNYAKNVTLLVLKCSSKPTLGSGCFAFNIDYPSATIKTYPVQSVHNWASTVLNSYKNNKTAFTFSALPVYEHLKYLDNKIQVDSAIRDGIGNTITSHYQKKMTVTTATLATSSWSGSGPYTKSVSVTGVTASNNVFVSPAPASFTHYGECGIYCSAQGSGTLTFTATTVPTSSLTVNVAIFN